MMFSCCCSKVLPSITTLLLLLLLFVSSSCCGSPATLPQWPVEIEEGGVIVFPSIGSYVHVRAVFDITKNVTPHGGAQLMSSRYVLCSMPPLPDHVDPSSSSSSFNELDELEEGEEDAVDIPGTSEGNAFDDNDGDDETTMREAYDGGASSENDVPPPRRDSSGSYTLTPQPALHVLAAALCIVPGKELDTDLRLLVDQSIAWSTLLPPGLFPAQTCDQLVGTFFACQQLTCDLEYEIEEEISPTEEGESASVSLPHAVGGLSPATPCCASTNSTFIIFNGESPPRIVQADALPVSYLEITQPIQLWESICGGSPDCSVSYSSCLVHMRDPRFYSSNATHSRWDGDGGLVFPVKANICGQALSDIISMETAMLLRRGYTAIISAAEHTDSLSMPEELIRSILAWVTVVRSQTAVSLQDSGHCKWSRNPANRTFYRTGRYVDCEMDRSMIGFLPQLQLIIDDSRIVQAHTEESNATNQRDHELCSFTLDLNKLVMPDGTLRIYSTGSFTRADRVKSLTQYREPLVVIGANFIEGSTIGITRSATLKTSADVPSAWRGLPLMYLFANNERLTVAEISGKTTAVCVSPASCAFEELYYTSRNRCAQTRCLNVYTYKFNMESMTCSVEASAVRPFIIMLLLLVAGEVALTMLRKRTERARAAHMQLVDQVQRKNN